MSGTEKPSGEGSLRHRALEVMKSVAFRTPMLNFLSRPRYPYNIDPAQLCWLVEAIDRSRAAGDPFTPALSLSFYALAIAAEGEYARAADALTIASYARSWPQSPAA